MWNNCIQLHAEQSKGCTPRFSIANEREIGLAWQQSLHCVNCQFKSGMYKLYDELPTGGCGQKPATTNVAFQIVLQDSAISNIKELRNNWWQRSQHLKAYGLHRVNMTDAYRTALQQLIEMRLGAPAF